MEPREYNKGLSRLRLAAVYAMVALLLWFARPTPLSVTVGFAVVALGEAIRLWAAGYLLKTTELVTSGPYRFTRNPLYLGRLLIFTGMCLMARLPGRANLVVLLLGWLVFFGYYLRRKERVEPQRLRETHGDAYERYFRAVPALFPTLRPFPDPNRIGWSSDRLRRNREGWMVVGLTLVTLFLLWRAYSPEAVPAVSAIREEIRSVPADVGGHHGRAVSDHRARFVEARVLDDQEHLVLPRPEVA